MNIKTITKISGVIAVVVMAAFITASTISAAPKENKGKDGGTSNSGSSKSESKNSGSGSGKTDKKTAKSSGTSTTTVPSNCPKTAFGHLISFGWIKKNGRMGVPEGCPLPPGIAKLIGERATSTTPGRDRTAPVINNLVTSAGTSTVRITWTTDEAASSRVYYSATSPVNPDATSTARVNDSTLLTTRTVVISGLNSNSTYYFIVESTDAEGNVARSAQFAAATGDAVGPVISSAQAVVGTSTVQVSWLTNELATSRVFYSTSTPVDLNTSQHVDSATRVTSHNLTVSGLATSTVYYLTLVSEDVYDNRSVHTTLPPITTGN